MNSDENKLSEEKLEECKRIFHEFDKNGDGTVSISELSDALKLLGCKPKESELNQIIKEFDQDNSGKLEFQEFIQVVSINMSETNTEEELLEAFKIIDRDQDGLISTDDLILLMTSIGERLSLEEAQNIIRELDPKNDGYIRYMELMRNRYGNK